MVLNHGGTVFVSGNYEEMYFSSSRSFWRRQRKRTYTTSLTRMIGSSFLVFLCFLSTFPVGVDSKWVEGVVDTTYSRWEFLTRFCFLSTHGTLKYDIRYPVGYGTQDILLYYDTPGQWDAIYDRGKNCEEKTSVLSIDSNQIISLNTSHTQTSAYSGCSLVQEGGDTWYHCVGNRAFKSMRERWWYIALARCGTPKDSVTGLYAKYKIHMTNGDDILHEEYSADQFYIFPINITFFILYVIMAILSGICAVILRQRGLFHSTYKLFMVSMAAWAFSLVLKVVAWGYYGFSGWEWTHVEITGRVLQSLSQVAFILLLILMAKGYTITRGFLTTTSIVKVTIFISFYFVTTCALFIWERIFFDPAKVLYYYECPPGYCMVALQLIAWCWFLYAAIFTLKHTDTKSLFYMPFFTFYTLWFWAGPIIIMVAMFAMAKWSREKTVNGVEQLVAFLGHAVFLILTRPSAANSNFPYHVRTTQIDFLKDDQSNNYHFDSKDVEHYVIKSGPDLNFFITSDSKNDREDIDNVSLVSCVRGDTNDVISASATGPKNDPLPVDLKNCWFDMVMDPPDYEEAANPNARGQPKPRLLPAIGQAPPITTDLPVLPQRVAEIPLALILPPSLATTATSNANDNGDFGLSIDPNHGLIRPRLSIVAENVVPIKTSLPPVAPPSIPLEPLPQNFPLALNSNPAPPPKFNFPSIDNFNKSPLQMAPPVPNQAPPPSFNFSSTNGPQFRVTPPSPQFNRNLSNNNNNNDDNTNNNNNNDDNTNTPPYPPLPPPNSDTPTDTITPAHRLSPITFPQPSPRTNKHTFSSTIALLTKTADATNIDDIVKNEKETKKKKKNKRKNKVILSQTVEQRESKFYDNSDGILDTGTKNILPPIDESTPRLTPRTKFPLPPLPPDNPLVDKYIKE